MRVHVTGWAADGRVVEDTRTGPPNQVVVSGTPAAWSDSLRSMKPGERRRIWTGGGSAAAAVLDLELLEVVSRYRAPPVPPELVRAPATARATKSGILYEAVSEGRGQRPEPGSTVTVDFRAWVADGSEADSSASRGGPTTMAVDEMLPGWREALGLMKEGGKGRFWIPADLLGPGRRQPLALEVQLIGVSTAPRRKR